MEPITTTVAIIYIADKIVGNHIKEIWSNKFLKALFPPKNYKSILIDVITSAINEFEAAKGNGQNIHYFYHYKEVIDKLIDRVIFQKNTFKLTDSFQDSDEIDVPSDEDLRMFFDLLITKINSTPSLRKFYVEEYYKDEIFKIGNDLKDLKENFKEVVKGFGGQVLEEYHHELDSIKKNIEEFKPQTAYDTLTELEKRISSRGNLEPKITSRINYLKALCLNELNEFDSGSKCLVQAYTSEPDNPEYQERAALAYWNLGLKTEAYDLATHVINHLNPLNERANAILFIKELETGKDFLTAYNEVRETPPAP